MEDFNLIGAMTRTESKLQVGRNVVYLITVFAQLLTQGVAQRSHSVSIFHINNYRGESEIVSYSVVLTLPDL